MRVKKYIVYLTINMVNGKIYIGMHSTYYPHRFDGYLGNGIQGKNSKWIKFPQDPFHFAVKKYGFDNFKRITLAVYDTKEEALEHEANLVNEYFIQRNDTYNITVGGNKPPVYERKIHKYDLEGNYICSYSSIVEAGVNHNCGSSAIGRAALSKRTSMNHLWSFDKVDKLNLSEYYVNKQAIAVYTSNIHNEVLNTYESLCECARDLNVHLTTVQKHLKLKTPINNVYIHYCTDSFTTNCKRTKRKVGQYDSEGNLIKIFDTVRACRKEFPNVQKVLRGQAKHCHGYFFNYIDE